MSDNDLAFVLTTFGKKCWESGVAKEMVYSFGKYWPAEIPLVVAADPDCRGYEQEIARLLRPSDLLTFERTPSREEWLKQHASVPVGADYRTHFVRWSHKVWCMNEAVHNVDGADHMIWMDSDIVTHSSVSIEDIKTWLPKNADISYMGRRDWSESETGFIGFKLNDNAKQFISEWHALFESGRLLREHDNQTDAYAFDVVRAMGEAEFDNLTANIAGRDVFDESPMASKMEHIKGPKRKKQYLEAAMKDMTDDPTPLMNKGALDVNNMGIKTKNNMPMESICNNIFHNLRNIEHWLDYLRPNGEEVVLVSAGPSLTREEIMPYVERGVKIVAVKHALDRLKSWGIQPWACILLDGRDHVGNFIEFPDKDVLYIVASMVDHTLVNKLARAQVPMIGYHAYVGAEIQQVIPAGHLLVEGGSATSTRGINVLHALGFRKIHIHGIDCCYLEKPNLAEVKENGKLKYMEVPIEAETWGGKRQKRTFWTEGQFLAQVQEFSNIYYPMHKNGDIELTVHGDGIVPWMWKNKLLHEKWLAKRKADMQEHIRNAETLENVERRIVESRKRWN